MPLPAERMMPGRADMPNPLVGEARGRRLGALLRDRRTVRRLTLKDVAAAAGISVGQLSQIERDLSEPSLRSLRAICAALDMPMSWLFEEGGGEDDIVVRSHQRRRFDLGPSGMAKELLSRDDCTGLQMMRIVLRPGSASGARSFDVSGQARCGLVLSGSLGLEVDDRRHVLGAGDAFSFEDRERLRFWCEGWEECVIVWVAAPAIY